ncbi:MAG: exodeoxyribonuclease VII large subunit [bacterium]|nr:exodeoxyribonuclease VII large subunit [bacterium]
MSLFDDVPPPPRRTARRPAAAPEQPQGTGAPGAAAAHPAGRPQAPPTEPRGPRVVSVSELSTEIGRRMQQLGRLAVEGELTALKHAGSGHVYFTLKDAGAGISCVIWRSRVQQAARFRLEEGARVVCHGGLDVYKPRGSYSLVVDRVERRGLGEQLAKLEELKAELKGRGWFERARTLPRMPGMIGVVTSRDADALRDFLKTRSQRWPLYPVRLRHTRVQGQGAAREIARALAELEASGVDLIVVIRGGGSLEDLWAFNELAVAEAIWRCGVPVVSGVGHETDVTLADLVADLRAHTPTDAAQRVLPDRATLHTELERRAGYLAEAMQRALERRTERLERVRAARTLRSADWMFEQRLERLASLERRLVSGGQRAVERAAGRVANQASRLASHSPRVWLERQGRRLESVAPRLASAVAAPLEARARALSLAERSLEATSPFNVLQRGYSITRRAGGAPLVRAGDVAPGETLETLLADGLVRSEVRETVDGEGAGDTTP